MMQKIVKTIQDDLITALYPSSIEAAYIYLPQTLTQNKVIAVVRKNKVALGYEIGQKMASTFVYSIDIILLINNADYETAIAEIDKLERLVVENLTLNSNLSTLESDDEGYLERVIKYRPIGTEYPDQLPPLDKKCHVAIISVEVQTEIHPN